MSEWNRIVSENAQAVLRIALRIIGSLADAEDITQDVFCEAWQFGLKQSIRNHAGLFRRLAVLRSLDRLRRRATAIPVADCDIAQEGDGPVQQAIARELADALRAGLQELPDQQAAAFALFHFEHLDREEIAEALETSVGAVSTALSKARKTLRNLVQEANQDD